MTLLPLQLLLAALCLAGALALSPRASSSSSHALEPQHNLHSARHSNLPEGAASPSFIMRDSVLAKILAEHQRDDASVETPRTSCSACVFLVKNVAMEGVKLKLEEQDLVTSAQSVCTANAFSSLLRVECSLYEDMQKFLVRGGMISSEPVALSNYVDEPRAFCDLVDLCGDPVPKELLHQAERTFGRKADPDRLGPALVRLRLTPDVASLPKQSNRWSAFKAGFAEDVGALLRIEPDRIEVKMNSGDDLAEVVIQPRSGGELKDGFQFSRQPPLELGRMLRAFLAPRSNALIVPPRLKAQVDPTFRLQVLPLVVPPSLVMPVLKPVPVHNYTGPSCLVLKHASLKKCGATMSCAPGCKEAFGTYFSKCLAVQLSEEEHDWVYAQYVQTFRICEQCTPKRKAEVMRRCAMNSTQTDFPTKCGLYCSEAFVPLYEDCLSIQMQDFPASQQTEINAFNVECAKCSKERVNAVKAICDTRENPPKNSFPASCIKNCSAVYMPFFDTCIYGGVNPAHKNAVAFRDRCQIAADGGLAFRLKLAMDLSQIEDQNAFRAEYSKEITAVLSIKPERLSFTLLQAYNPPASASSSNASSSSSSPPPLSGSVLVDTTILNSDNMLDPNPRALVNELRYLVALPSSPVFSFTMLKLVDVLYGVRTLVAGTHDEAAQQPLSSLDYAQEKLQAAVEAGAEPSRIAYLQSIVRFQKDHARGVTATQESEDLSAINYMQSVFKKEPAASIRARYADYQVAYMANAGESASTVSVYQAHATYMDDVAANAPKNTLLRDQALFHYMTAVDKGESETRLKVLEAIYNYLRDVVSGQPEAKQNLDKALITYLKGAEKPVAQDKLAELAAIVDYMQAIAVSSPVAILQAKEAVVEYLAAIADKDPNYVVAEKQALMEYQRAVADGASLDTINTWAQLALTLHQVTLQAQAREASIKANLAQEQAVKQASQS